MADMLAIDIKLVGVNQAVQGMRIIARSTQSVANAQMQQAKTAQAMIQAQTAGIRLQQAQLRLANQQAAAAKKAQGGTLGSKISSLVTSSRIGAGVGLMPLVGKVIGILGTEASLVAGSFAALYAAAKSAADGITDFRKSMVQGGGTAGQTAQLGALGVDGSRAHSFTDKISSDSMAQSYAARYGVHDYGVQDTTNKAQKLLKWIDILSNLKGEERLRAAEATGTTDLLLLADASKEVRQQVLKEAAERAKLITPEMATNAANFNIRLQALQDSFGMLAMKLGGLVIPMVTDFVRVLTKIVDWVSSNLPDESQAAKMTSGSVLPGSRGIKTPKEAAEDEHTKAMREHAEELRRTTRQGTFGGGANARNAVPAAWNGANFSNGWSGTRAARAMGAMV